MTRPCHHYPNCGCETSSFGPGCPDYPRPDMAQMDEPDEPGAWPHGWWIAATLIAELILAAVALAMIAGGSA